MHTNHFTFHPLAAILLYCDIADQSIKSVVTLSCIPNRKQSARGVTKNCSSCMDFITVSRLSHTHAIARLRASLPIIYNYISVIRNSRRLNGCAKDCFVQFKGLAIYKWMEELQQNTEMLQTAFGHAICIWEMYFCRQNYLCPTKVTFVWQKLILLRQNQLLSRKMLLLTQVIFVIRGSYFGHQE